MWVSGAVPGFLENLNAVRIITARSRQLSRAARSSSKAEGNSDSRKTQQMVEMGADELAWYC